MGLVARNSAVLLGGVAISLLMGTGALRAQDNPPVDGAPSAEQEAQTTTAGKKGRVTVLQRLVVGAGVEKVAIDTPQAVTVVDQEDIDRQQASTVGDTLKEVPGVQVLGSDRVFGEAFNIRGIGITENSADAARIVVTVDGAPKFNEQYRMGSFFSDPELYKKIEVLRGPASSTLYGSGALGGVINFVTKDASDFIAEGDRGTVRLKSAYETNGDGTLLSGIWAHRFSDNLEVLAQGNWRRSDDVKKANGRMLAGSEFDAYSGLFKATYRIDDEQVIRASYQRWDSDAEDQPYTQTSTTDPLQGFGTLDRHVIDNTYVLSYENPAADNPWLDLNVALTYSDTQNSQSDIDSALIPTPPNPATTGQLAILYPTDYAYKTLQLKADNTFDYVGDSFENYLTVGFQASRQNRIADRPTGAATLPAHPEGLEDKLGLFAQNEFIWNDRLTIIPGIRADFYRMTPDESVVAYTPLAQETTGTAVSPKVAALYKFTDSFSVFGSVAHTERFPTLDELFSTAIGAGGVVTRSPSLGLVKEKSNNYEIGFATSAFDIGGGSNSLGFKATGFLNDIEDGIRSNPFATSGGAPYYINVNDMRIYGVELEGSFESDRFFSRLAYTHLQGEYTTGYTYVTNTMMGPVVTTIVPGQALETIPQDKLVLTLGARVPDRGLTFGTTVTFAAEPDYAVSAASTGDPDTSAGDWTKVDLFASWKPEDGNFAGWEAQFGVQNLFNADYRENLRADRSKGRSVKFTLTKQIGYQ